MSSYESERRPVAVYEFAGSLAIESKKSYSCIYKWPSFYGARLQRVMVVVFIKSLTSPVQHDKHNYQDSLQVCLRGNWSLTECEVF